MTPPGGSTANILNDGTKVWSQALQGCGIWVYYVMDETALNFGAADAQINTKVKAVDFLKQHRNPRLKKYFVHMIIGENTPAWGTGSGRGYSFIGEADKDKRGIYMFFQPASAVPTQGGYMKVFAHELMHLMYNNTTGDWDAGSHLIDPDGDGHLY